MVRLLGAAVVALAFVLAACGGGQHEVDEKAWRTALEEQLGHEVADWPEIRDFYVDELCQESNEKVAAYAAVSADGGDLELTRLNVSHACPDRLDMIEQG